MIARNPSLTEQVKSHLKARILEGAFPAGRIPPETELAADLGVSRTTVRDALSRLEQEGVVVRRQGAGTFVNDAGLRIKSRLEEIWSYEGVLRDHGYTPSVEVLDIRTERPGEEIAADLGLAPGMDVVTIEKLFLEDDEPVVLTFNRMPATWFDPAVAAEEAARPVYELLEQRCGRHLAYYLCEIVPATLDRHTASRMGVRRGTPAISFEEIGYDQDNEPVVRASSYFRDDLLRFRLIRRKAGA